MACYRLAARGSLLWWCSVSCGHWCKQGRQRISTPRRAGVDLTSVGPSTLSHRHLWSATIPSRNSSLLRQSCEVAFAKAHSSCEPFLLDYSRSFDWSVLLTEHSPADYVHRRLERVAPLPVPRVSLISPAQWPTTMSNRTRTPVVPSASAKDPRSLAHQTHWTSLLGHC